MIHIHKEVENNLNKIFRKTRKHLGKAKGLENLDIYVNNVLKKHTERKEKEFNREIGCNSGLSWTIFLRQNKSKIFIRDGGKCTYCGKKLTRSEASIDHIKSPQRGGLNELNNMTLSCDWCNNDKGILLPEEYFYKQLVNKSKGIEPPK